MCGDWMSIFAFNKKNVILDCQGAAYSFLSIMPTVLMTVPLIHSVWLCCYTGRAGCKVVILLQRFVRLIVCRPEVSSVQ